MTTEIKALKIAFIGGGSRAWAVKLMTDLALDSRLGGTLHLYDLDQDSAEENRLLGERIFSRPDAVGNWETEVTGSLSEALEGSDFVVISVFPGSYDQMEVDVHFPESYGVYQPVGDTTGPGGFFRAWRTVPIFLGLAQAVETHCPDAWVINYTNPMALCTRALFAGFPKIHAVGCCHEVFETQKILAAMAGESLDVIGIPREEIRTNVVGLNHFTWFDSAYWKGTDLFPIYKGFVDRFRDKGYEALEAWDARIYSCAHKVKFDLFRQYGLIAAAGDRHLAEFLGPDYLGSPANVAAWKFHLTTVEYRRGERLEREGQRRRMIDEGIAALEPSGEEGVRIMAALLGQEDVVTNINLPNIGQIPDLPEGTVVETNAVVAANSVRPLVAGSLRGCPGEMLALHAGNQDILMEAIMEGRIESAYRGFESDPLLADLDTNARRHMFDGMCDAHRVER